jgi:hypothetical protein
LTVQLAVLPEKRATRIVVGTTCRKPADVLRHYLASLAWQELPPNTTLVPVFVNDGLDAEASQVLHEFVTTRGGEVIAGMPAPQPDFSDAHPDSHQWSQSAMARVGAHKDAIIQRAIALDADYLWFADSDLICDRTTLASLLSCGASIATAVYWTRWSARGTETRKVHAAPQVWLRHPYDLAGAGYSEWEFRDRLARRQITKVAGYGACTLLSRRALDAGVSFAYLPDVPQVGLMAGEDRHFCIRAQRLHLDAVADPWPDIFHIYHLPSDLARAPEFAARLSISHHEQPDLGDLVSFTVQALEPIPWGGGGYTQVPPQRVRGRLGTIALVPEIEEALYALRRGEFRDIAVHFPVHYPVPAYAGRRRLFRVTLHDVKMHGWAPVLEEEILMGAASGAGLRTVDYTAAQLDGMKEVAHG